MGNLNRAALLSKKAFKIEKVELGDQDFVFIKEMSGHERDAFEALQLKEVKNKKGAVIDYKPTLEDFRSKLAVCVLCDEKGEMLLDVKDWRQLGGAMTATNLSKIADAAAKLNALTSEDVEQMVKN